MKKKPSITELHHSGKYALVESFSVKDKANFWAKEIGLPTLENSHSLKKQVQKPTFWLLIFVSIALGGAIGYMINTSVEELAMIPYASYFKQIIFAIFFFLFCIIPLHESIHLLTYRALGADNVGFYRQLSKGIFEAYAHRFVITLKEHALVSMMPFVFITSILVIGLVTLHEVQVFVSFTLLFHTLLCWKDFIVLRHYLRRRHQTFFLYDDYQQHRSYLFSTIYIR